MNTVLVYAAGTTPASDYARSELKKHGISITDHPMPEITHLLLDVPSFRADGRLRSGGDPEVLLSMLPGKVTVAGGNLDVPMLSEHKSVDFLKDPQYLALNAAITAECALQIAAPLLPATLSDTTTLIIGWGRIGKCLCRLLKAAGADVIVAARKESDRAMLKALGYTAVDTIHLYRLLPQCGLIFNTVPHPMMDASHLDRYPNIVKIDLASIQGLQGDDIHWARGLPGQLAPETSGKLIAQTFLRLCQEG